MSATQDLGNVRILLSAWKLLELSQYFEDEGIGVEELQFIKPHHVQIILSSFKLGVRIRFEHYLEKWRRDTNNPLHALAGKQACSCQCSPVAVQGVKPIVATIGTNTDMTFASNGDSMSSLTPQLGMPRLTPQPRLVEAPQLASPKPTITTTNHNNNSAIERKLPTVDGSVPVMTNTTLNSTSYASPAGKLPILPKSTGADSPMLVVKSVKHHDASYKQFGVTVLDMLKDAGTRGTNIIEYHREFKKLTAAHRTQLIQLIVEYFDHNNIHLSLNLSHHIETEILKLFPGERLEYYRTEKRGRIYVKFCNMKRYRRDRPWPDKTKRQYMDLEPVHIDQSNWKSMSEPQPSNDSNSHMTDEDDDMYVQDVGTWLKADEKVQVKNETMDDDDDCIPL